MDLTSIKEKAERPGRSKGLLFRRLLRSKFSLFGLLITAGAVLTAVLAPLLAPHSPVEIFPFPMSPPSGEFLLGTDYLGRCLLSRVIYGAQVSIGVATFSVAISLTLGIILGLLAGFYEGKLGGIILRGMDVLLSFPLIILALGIIAMLGPSMINLTLTIGVVYTPAFVRLVNGSVLSVKGNEYVRAARALGSRDARILFSDILPNIVAPIIVQASLTFSTAILVESALSFLGVGTQPPTPSWGAMISESRTMMELAPWTVIYPGLALSVTVIGLNLLGDGLRDAFDQFLKP
ncbi:MAG TPA: ABC transporter permease [Thermodesulfobacteriota bacterium]|nr:ABC transporter permease [Thermodesulfobacteriota bacterium]